MANGEFDGLSVDNLRAMLAGADADKLTAAGTALGDAGPKILDIGSDLRHHVSRVEWTGEGGSAFREWAHDFALEVMRFGQFTTTVGKHVAQAGQTLSETKSALPASRDPRATHEDPAAQKAATQEAEEARHQLERLSSAYRAAQQTMEAEREPQFKVLPIEGDSIWGRERGYGSEAREAAASAGTDASRAQQQEAGGSAPSRQVADEQNPRQATGTHIDSTTTLPKPEVGPPAEGPTAPADPSRQPSPVTTPSVPHVPSAGNQRTVSPEAGRSVPRLPAMRGGGEPVLRSPASRAPVNDDVAGGQQRRLGSSSRLPRGMVVGEDTPMSRGVPGGGGYPAARAGGVPGSETAPVGRRFASEPGGQVSGPRTSNPSSAGGRQRGAVIGDEGGSPLRGPGPGTASPGTAGAVSGSSTEARRGNRVASEPGGSIADPHTFSRRGATFTRGGTGLVRSDHAEGPAPSRTGELGTSRSGADRGSVNPADNQAGWELGRQDTLPPVIE